MKKRFIALSRYFASGILAGSLLTGCGRDVEVVSDLPAGITPAQVQTDDVTPTDVTPTETETKEMTVEERIAAIGQSYDGCYEPPEMDVMFNSTVAVSSSEKAEDAADPGIFWNTESYNAVAESGFVSTATQPFSTFGADVDTATYSNFRRSVFENDGFGIRGDAIRIEEMVNYFAYDYPNAKDGEKFGVVTSLTDCPWNPDTLLLRVGVKAEEIAPQNGSNIVFLIDTSGSMFDENKLPLAQKAFGILQEQLTEKDTVSIVTYAGTSEVALEGTRGNEHQKIQDALDALEAGGSTNGEGGIVKAYAIAKKYFIEGGNNRVILATDGDLNVGVTSEADLIKLIEEQKKSGIFLSCLGFGEGNYQDDKMEALADHGNGNYAFVDCGREAERVLKDEIWSTLYTVAKDVKFQVEFNPETVKGYRLVGYENRKMAAEDFKDDTKDGGEIGSGQRVTVLYEVVPRCSAYEIPEPETRYEEEPKMSCCGGKEECTCEDPSKCEMEGMDKEECEVMCEFLAVNIRYKEPDQDESVLLTYPVGCADKQAEMDADTSWAAGVAQFGMLLRGSEFAGTSTYEDIYNRLVNDPAVMTDDFKAEFLYMLGTVKGQQ